MESLFAFLASYWWLAFPAIGVIGAVAGNWEQFSKRRHKRRIELLKARTELTAARAAVRASDPPQPITKPSAVPTPLERIIEAHEDVTRRWLEYELDVGKLIAYPTMSDGRQELTAAFLRTKKVADRLRPESRQARLSRDELSAYSRAVTDYEVAFDLAEREARRVRDSQFSEAERRRLATARQLLATAVDDAATPAERQTAYRRVRQELDGLIAVSDAAAERLEERIALAIERPSTTGSSSTGPSTTPPPAPPASA